MALHATIQAHLKTIHGNTFTGKHFNNARTLLSAGALPQTTLGDAFPKLSSSWGVVYRTPFPVDAFRVAILSRTTFFWSSNAVVFLR